jgi:TonB family protein
MTLKIKINNMKKITSLVSLAVSLVFMLTINLNAKAQENETKTEIYTVVDEMPLFPGGQTALDNYIRTNLQYPAEAKKYNKEGTVHCSFIIEPDGSVSNVNIIRKIGYGCDEEVVRIISSMPKWVPGKKNGKNVKVQMFLPINFSITR